MLEKKLILFNHFILVYINYPYLQASQRNSNFVRILLIYYDSNSLNLTSTDANLNLIPTKTIILKFISFFPSFF